MTTLPPGTLAEATCAAHTGKRLKRQQLDLPPAQSPPHLSWRRADFLRREEFVRASYCAASRCESSGEEPRVNQSLP